jgi:hypothetical protein
MYCGSNLIRCGLNLSMKDDVVAEPQPAANPDRAFSVKTITRILLARTPIPNPTLSIGVFAVPHARVNCICCPKYRRRAGSDRSVGRAGPARSGTSAKPHPARATFTLCRWRATPARGFSRLGVRHGGVERWDERRGAPDQLATRIGALRMTD